MSALWRETTRMAPAAPPVATRCQPRDACGGADRRLIMHPRGLPRRPAQLPSQVPWGALEDPCVSRGRSPLTCGAPWSRFSWSRGPWGGWRPLLRLCPSHCHRLWLLSHSVPRATIPIKTRAPVVQQLSATAFYPAWGTTMDKTLFVRCQKVSSGSEDERCTAHHPQLYTPFGEP